MKAYRITSADHDPLVIFAEDDNHAAALATLWQRSKNTIQCEFAIDEKWVHSLTGIEREHVEEALSWGLSGVGVRHGAHTGWAIADWPSGPKEQPAGAESGSDPIRIFQFRDPTPIEAFVLAPDQEAAALIFKLHLEIFGGDSETLLWRGWALEDLDEPERSVLREAQGLGRHGLVFSEDGGRWVFVIPLDKAPTRKRGLGGI